MGSYVGFSRRALQLNCVGGETRSTRARIWFVWIAKCLGTPLGKGRHFRRSPGGNDPAKVKEVFAANSGGDKPDRQGIHRVSVHDRQL